LKDQVTQGLKGKTTMDESGPTSPIIPSFYERPQVKMDMIAIGAGIPVGIEQVRNPEVGIAGAYGAWGESYDNQHLRQLIEDRLSLPLAEDEKMNLAELGFIYRHLLPGVSALEHIELELEVGSRFLAEAAAANGWDPSEVEAVLIGTSGPVTENYTEQIATRAGIPDSALKVSIHKACDGSVGGLNLALNPALLPNDLSSMSIAEALQGKKVLVGGIEGLSRFIMNTRDKYALQLFGNGAAVIGVIPGETMKFLVGKTHEVFDEEGVLKVHMFYPHSRTRKNEQSMIEVTEVNNHHLRVAGLMHEPDEELIPLEMSGPMGMVKLFVRSGVEVVRDVYQAYQQKMAQLGLPDKSIAVAIVHHANLKINRLKEKTLQREGIFLPMPWLLSEFGNVSAASPMIAFLRQLPKLKPGDHVLFDGFGAGTYYDALAVELGGM
jgi:3-oxoacyl-[acyl-carrier-protein] synthase III